MTTYLCVSLFAIQALLPGQTVLVDQGQPRAVVAIPDSPNKKLQAAAKDLVWHLERMSGARLPIQAESRLTAAHKQGVLIVVGPTELAREAGIDAARLPPEGYVVRAHGNRLFLVGHAQADRAGGDEGTPYAVTAFLEEDLGVRWLWPGELGTIVPQRRTVVVPEGERQHQPPLAQRKIRNSITNVKFVDGMKRVATDPARYKQMVAESGQWQQRMRLGSRTEISAGHAFGGWYDKYHEKHPEYFALHLNGSRAWGGPGLGAPKNVKLCVSQPAVLGQWIANVKAALEKNPSLACFSASPNDGYYTGHCTCPECRRWDVAEAADRYTYFDVDANGPASYEYVTLSDRYTRFYNLCAQELVKFAPDKLVGGYAYGTWRSVPLREKVHSNVVIGFVGLGYFDEKRRQDDLNYWNGWSKLATRLYLRPNLLHGGDAFPAVYVHKLAADFRHCFETGMMATDFDSLVHHWGTQGLNYYVLAKLLWDPHADVDRMVDDYCRAGFGPAAAAVKEYFLGLEKLTDTIAQKYTDATELVASEQKTKRQVYFWQVAHQWYTPDVLAAMAAKLAAAEKAAAGDKQVLARVGFLREGLRYAELRARALAVRQAFNRLAPDAPQRSEKRKELNAVWPLLKEYYLQQATSWVIAPQLVRMLSDEMPGGK